MNQIVLLLLRGSEPDWPIEDAFENEGEDDGMD